MVSKLRILEGSDWFVREYKKYLKFNTNRIIIQIEFQDTIDTYEC